MSTSASSADAFSGDPSRAAAASFAAGTVQAVLLLPANTVQTHMQHAGRPMLQTLRVIFASGGLPGVRLLYRALGPTVAMLGVRQGFKFGSGAAVKSRLPTSWPELARDAVSGGSSAVATTTVLFPIDTLKTRWQLGRASPRLPQLYQGFTPAVIYSAFGMSIWLCSRNILERTIPDPGRSSALQHWKHFAVDGPPRSAASELRLLVSTGGLGRLYSGFGVKCAFVALNSAIFNSVYMQCRRLMRMHS
ncbi:hypothetical protein EMIHUDRAFT_222527 [Emiliania huxleyi CCMP1516]|uniref:Mitochondrial carrier protein n=2 Tax=Emiliania huxleyi TaxID=2903 RepID=A0A0D3KYC0_EMIH1|nr:hypothetical protein EMIHUDRAFT_222527 [Emiliania huxleyi CCMP1516]EOD40755.1 hypothetical protein EMIHUDRAFT_222527 [Emiliania huxleyi CCMP1516]|eukprot:XP_005793184.1 hypothetical protein EMIHUDRAFT_222527 [Emiliania huxleyi CCMP1516]